MNETTKTYQERESYDRGFDKGLREGFEHGKLQVLAELEAEIGEDGADVARLIQDKLDPIRHLLTELPPTRNGNG